MSTPYQRLFTQEFKIGDHVSIIRDEHGWYDSSIQGKISKISDQQAIVIEDQTGYEHLINHPRDLILISQEPPAIKGVEDLPESEKAKMIQGWTAPHPSSYNYQAPKKVERVEVTKDFFVVSAPSSGNSDEIKSAAHNLMEKYKKEKAKPCNKICPECDAESSHPTAAFVGGSFCPLFDGTMIRMSIFSCSKCQKLFFYQSS